MIPYIQLTTFQLGPVALQTWGTLVAAGFVTGLIFTLREVRRRKLDPDMFLSMFFWIFLASLVGSRLLYVLLYWQHFISAPLEIVQIWRGGMVYLGGLLGALPVGILYAKYRFKIPFPALTDLVAPGLALGLAVGRLGCSLINDHPGALTNLPWGILWPDGSVRHPVAVYLVLFNIILFFLLLSVRKRWGRHQGAVTVAFLLAYGIGRFFLDFSRAADVPEADPRFLFLTVSQYFSLFFVIGSLFWLTRLRVQTRAARRRRS